MKRTHHHPFILAVSLAFAAGAHAQIKGPSTGSTPYALPVSGNVKTYSIATVDNTGANPDDVFARTGGGTYSMTGVPDGLGAFDNGDGTFTVLMNHEIPNTSGVVRAHGSTGAFVSQWIISKNDFSVVSAKDLITTLNVWDSGTSSYVLANPATNGRISRLCSADLPATSAFFNSSSGLGTTARIFMNGEETGHEGRAFGHIVTGAAAGTSYELPALGKFSWENSLASPYAQDKTVVIGTDDTTPGQVYLYVGNKTASGTDVEKAGLTNGSLYGITIPGLPSGSANDESRTTNVGIPAKGASVPFALAATGTGPNTTGAVLQSTSETLGITEFLRPEDGAWDTQSPNRFYFVTADRYDQVKDGVGAQVGRSRLWALDFSDITNPTAGGNIKLLLDGSESLAQGGLNMMDNIAVDLDGNVLIAEDVGNTAHNGKLARYNPTTGTVEILAQHDPARNGDIGLAATAPFTQDEEFSGVLDVTAIMQGSALNTDPNLRWYLFDDQQHYSLGGAQVEGGQLLIASAIPEPSTMLFGAELILLAGFRRARARRP